MADLAITARSTTNRRIDPVRPPGEADQLTLPAAEAITAGAPVRLDTTTGRWMNANATTAAESTYVWIALRTVAAGEGVTAYRRGIVSGYDLDALDYGAAVYLSDTDGRLADAAGTVSVIVGRVVPIHDRPLGETPGKAIHLELG